MRTTVNLSKDVAAGVERLRRERGVGLSEALNDLARAGLAGRGEAPPIAPPSYDMGMRVDVANVGEVIDLLESEDAPRGS